MLNLNVIQCKDFIYISKGECKNCYSTYLSDLMFDGIEATETFKQNWYKLDSIPKKVEKVLPKTQINIRYELKAGYTPSELLPEVIKEYIDEEISGLYERKYDLSDNGYEELKFTINVIYKKDDFEWVKSNYNSNHDIISQIEFHPDILQEKPCCIYSEEMYKIIRNHVKANINNTVATIKSDYDFHFEVVRKLLLAEPYTVRKDLNALYSRRKSKWVTENICSKEVSILNLKRKSSDNDYGSTCKLAPDIYGKNQLDLENKVNEYLNNLMEDINTQFKECECCKGWGVVRTDGKSI